MPKSVKEITDALSAILSAAEAEGRDLTEDELTATSELETDLADAKDRQERTAKVRDLVLAAQAKAKEAAGTPALVTERDKGQDPATAAFNRYLRTGKTNSELVQITDAQSEGSPSEGGYLVPPELRRKLVERMKAFGGLANVVEEITTETGNSIFWPTIDDTGNMGEVVSEGGTFSGGADLVFGQEELSAYSYMAGGTGGVPLRVSRELAQDAAFDIEGLVARKLGERLARIQAPHLVSGTGVSQPKGIVNGKTGIQTAANNAITYDDLLGYVHSVDPAYRNGGRCRWAFNDKFLLTIRKIKDTTGRALLKGVDDGVLAEDVGGATLLGYPVTIDQAFPDFTNNSPTINYGAFGDLEEGFVVRRVKAMELLVNPYSRMANRQIEYSVWARMDAIPQNPNAYVALTGKT